MNGGTGLFPNWFGVLADVIKLFLEIRVPCPTIKQHHQECNQEKHFFDGVVKFGCVREWYFKAREPLGMNSKNFWLQSSPLSHTTHIPPLSPKLSSFMPITPPNYLLPDLTFFPYLGLIWTHYSLDPRYNSHQNSTGVQEHHSLHTKAAPYF